VLRWRTGALAALWIILAVGLAWGEKARGAAAESRKRFEIIVTRNMFSKSRSEARPAPRAATRETRPREGRYIFLRGVAAGAKGYEAFLEDVRTGETRRYKVGDTLAEGRIQQITLMHVEYVKDRTVSKVEIGQAIAELGTSTSASATGDSLSSEPTAAPVSGSAKSLLERLRARRRKELGK